MALGGLDRVTVVAVAGTRRRVPPRLDALRVGLAVVVVPPAATAAGVVAGDAEARRETGPPARLLDLVVGGLATRAESGAPPSLIGPHVRGPSGSTGTFSPVVSTHCQEVVLTGWFRPL